MDSKTIAIVIVVFMCALLFPVFIGIIGGIFGILGSILGGIMGLIGGIFGVVFGIFGAVFGAIFGFFGWLFDTHHYWDWPLNFFRGDLFAAILLVIVIVLIARSRTARTGR